MRAEVAFSAEDLALARFAVSPMWQTVSAYRMLTRPGSPAPYRRWLVATRPAVRDAGLTRGWLAELVPAHGYLADFLTPFPRGGLEDELAAIRGTDPDRVGRELDMLAAERASLDLRRVDALRHDPAAVLPEITDEITAFWDLAIAPHWPRIRSVLEADVLHRARQVAEHGTGHVLTELHETVTWDDGSLRLVARHCQIARDDTGEGLLLLPNAFAHDAVLTRAVPPEPPQLSYPARGSGSLFEPADLLRVDALAGVLGRTRAAVLAALDVPTSTTGLSHLLGISPACVSAHLTAMRDAGLVRAHRAGRSVLYARTDAADALLAPTR